MRLSRGSIAFCLGITVYVLIWVLGFRQFPMDIISNEAVLGTVDKLPYVTFYSSKSPDRPNSPIGWWSVAQNEVGQFVVVPGRINNAESTLVYSEREGMVKISVKSSSWRHAGLLEGYVLSRDIKLHLEYFKEHYKRLKSAWEYVRGDKLATFEAVANFFASQAESLRIRLPPGLEVFNDVLEHLQGIVDGYNARYAPQIAKQKWPALTLADLFLLNSYHELVDAGMHVIRKPLTFGLGEAKAQHEKKFGRETSLLASLLLSGRVSASLMSFDAVDSGAKRNWTTTRAKWENQPWYPSYFRRVFSRVSIGSGVNTYGYQFVGFPGQVISMDSFSISIAQKRMTALVMRQCDFSPSSVAKPEPPTAPMSAWMVVSSAFHTPNITFVQYLSLWRQLKPTLLSTDWKSVAVSDNQIAELELHHDSFQAVPLLDSIPPRNFYVTAPTFTRLNDEQLALHGFKSVKHERNVESSLQTTSVDAYNWESLYNILQNPPDLNQRRILSAATSPTLEQVERDLTSRFSLDISRQIELIELSTLS